MKTKEHLAKIVPSFNHCKFLKYVKVNKETECWEWVGALSRKGYGFMKVTTPDYSKIFYAHRLSYTLFKHELNPVLRLDHCCKNRKCVNPNHLREVSGRVNTLENSNNVGAINKLKTHCKFGHEFSVENVKTRGRNGRVCIKCSDNYNKRRKSKLITSEPGGLPLGVNKTRYKTFMARLRIDGQEYCIGSFKTLEEAIFAHREVHLCWFGKVPDRFNKEGM